MFYIYNEMLLKMKVLNSQGKWIEVDEWSNQDTEIQIFQVASHSEYSLWNPRYVYFNLKILRIQETNKG